MFVCVSGIFFEMHICLGLNCSLVYKKAGLMGLLAPAKLYYFNYRKEPYPLGNEQNP